MCELFGLTGPDEIVVNEYLETFASHSVDHPNGWGIALFCGKEVNIEKEPVAAYRSSANTCIPRAVRRTASGSCCI